MANVKTLLRIPEILEAVNPLISNPVTHKDVFRLIGTGDIKPFGFIQRIPIFTPEQIGEVAEAINNTTQRSLDFRDIAPAGGNGD